MSRGLSVIAIVALHSSLWVATPLLGDDSSTASRVWEVANNRLGTVRLPLLLLLSGWLASGRLRREDGLRKTLAAVAANAWLYGVWLTVYLVVAQIVDPIEIVDPPDSPGELVQRYVLPLVTPLWFVWALAVYNVVLRLVRRVPPTIVLAALFVAGWVLDLTVGDDTEPMWMRAIRLAFYFAVGVYGRDVLRPLVERRAAGLVAVVGVVVSAALDRLLPALLHHVFTVALSLCVAVFVMWVMRVASSVRAVRGPLQWIGTRTVAVYVMHPALLVVLTALCRPVQGGVVDLLGGQLGRLLLPLVVTVVVTALSLAVQGALRRISLADVAFNLPRPWRKRLTR